MAELKHNFTKGRMNKDLDERLVPNGEYRDAMNIEVSTSEDSNIGTIQTTLGNTLKSATGTSTAFTVGSIQDNKTNKVYWMVFNDQANATRSGITKDMIVEYNPATETTKYVFVDIWKVISSIGTSSGSAVKYLYIALGSSTATNNISGIRKGMRITGTFNGTFYGSNSLNEIYVENVEYDASYGFKITLNRAIQTVAGEQIVFTAERVLNFSRNHLITGINVVDDMLFWTDGNSEPKKINITRGIKGTGGSRTLNTNPTTTFQGDNYNHHTRLVIEDIEGPPGAYKVATNRLGTYPVYAKESHLTVLRPAPQAPLELDMSRTSYNRGNAITGVSNRTDAQATIQFFTSSTAMMEAGDFVQITFDQAPDYRVGDVVIITNDQSVTPTDYIDYEVRVQISQIPTGHSNNNLMLGIFEAEILSISDSLTYNANGEQFFTLLEQKDSIFEFKFPRFSYRYKYTDGEYSAFAPFSEVAFLPGPFDYEPKKGHNLGMTNRLKSLCLKKYVPEPGEIGSARPSDVVAIDILYKESNNTNIYTVKTITSKDDHPVWPDLVNRAYARGEVVIDTEMIHAVLPSDQFLRPFDVVPRKAKAQEITGNRLLYGNYTQNYNVDKVIDIETSLQVNSFDNYKDFAEKSVKSIRDYQVGIVYLDKYGRETPVLVGPEKGVQRVSKVFSDNYTKIKAVVKNQPPSWAHAFKFYIKEPSNEYYNLAMDRWYNAKDGNIWISFPSSERNKIDEDTYLILKKSHADNSSVADDNARYKVIAIENEAPDYIKKDRKVLGDHFDNTAKTHIGNGGDGFPLPGFDYIEVPYAAMNNSDMVIVDASGTADPKSPHLQDDLFIKVRSADNESAEYEVVAITNTGQGGNYKIKLAKPLGDDCEFTSTAQTYATRISGLFLELIQYKIENKAEFDGRFFVKIENDQLIREKIVGKQITSEENMAVYSARNVRYLKPVNDHPRHAAMPDSVAAQGANVYDYDWTTSTGFGGVDDSLCNAALNNGYNFWDGFIRFNRNGNGSGFFIDEDSVVTNPPASSGTGVMATTNYGTGVFETDSLVEHDGRKVTGYGSFNGAEEPKGIWRYAGEPMGTRIDISWVGFEDTSYGPNNPPELWSQHGQDIQPEDYEFSKEWFQRGAKFRFADDPDGTIYEVLDYRYERGIRNFQTTTANTGTFSSIGTKRNNGRVYRDKWTLKVNPPIVRTASGFYPTDIRHDGTQNMLIELVRKSNFESAKFTDNPGVWETEPKKDTDLDVYYEASATYPVDLNSDTNEMFAPIGSTVSLLPSSSATVAAGTKVFSWSDNTVTLDGSITDPAQGEIVVFTRPDGGQVTAKIQNITASTQPQGITIATGIQFYRDVANQKMTLAYSNCFSFPQGVESDRIRDDFNQVTIGKGVKASTVLAEQYNEEQRKSGLIFSGIYNSMNGINNLNQFIASSGITKDLNTQYGSIQKLFTRDNNVVAFCEDKVLKILANKDALFNADGNVNLTATNRVLGTAQPFGGEFGISKNPESFAQENFRIYFTDKARGAVLRLSMDGLTVISNQGMEDYFRDNLPLASDLIGSYDKKKNLYNLTLHDRGINPDGTKLGAGISYTPKINTTVSYSEKSKGWPSFKSFVKESGLSLDNNYYTFKNGEIYLHHDNSETNNFYGTAASSSNNALSSVTVLLNDQPGSVKSFNTLNYEGTQSQVNLFTTETVDGVSYNDNEFYNLQEKKGWFVDAVTTDLQTARLKEFKEKEGKWFNYLYGEATNLANLDSKEFSYQGIGFAESVSYSSGTNEYTLTVQDDPSDH